jgi:hypothetical protein
MNKKIGMSAKVAIAHDGIRPRDFAALMYAGSGFETSAFAGVSATTLATGAAAVVAGVDAETSLEDASPPAALRSRERFSRCSGISVTGQSFRAWGTTNS